MKSPDWWREIGGPASFSRWSLIFLFPLGLVLHLTSGLVWVEGLDAGDVLAVFIGQSVAVVVAGGWWAAFFREPSPAHRPVLALLAFASVGVTRAVGIDATLFALGQSATYIAVTRVVLGVGLGIIGFSVVAVVAGLSRRSRAIQARLALAQQRLEGSSAEAEDTIARMEAEVTASANHAISELVTGLTTDPPTKSSAVAALKTLNEERIRPLSQQVMQTPLVSPLALEAVGLPRPLGRKEALQAVLRNLEPPPWWVVTVLLGPIVLLFYIRAFGLALAPLLALIVVAFVAVGSWVIERALRALHAKATALPGGSVFPILLAFFTGLALIVILLAAEVADLLGSSRVVSWSNIAILPSLALGIALVRANLVVLANTEQLLADALRETSARTQTSQARAELRRERLVHLLHTDIQGQLVAEILRLSSPRQPVGSLADFLESMRRVLLDYTPTQSIPLTENPEVALRRLIRLWQSAAPVAISLAPTAMTLLSTDPDLSEAALTVVSEALTNAVRHGQPGTIQVKVETEESSGESEVVISVTNPGTLAQPVTNASGEPAASLGLQRIGALAPSWSLTENSGQVTLRASLA